MTQQAVARFESELRQKIQFKASSKVSLDAILFKAFKFFDLYNNGWLTRADFFKAIAKCGVVINQDDVSAVYTYYDPSNTGRIDYRQFVQNFLFSNRSDSESEMSKSHLSKTKQINAKQTQPIKESRLDKKSNAPSQFSPSDKLKESHYEHFDVQNLSTLEEIIQKIQTDLRADGISGLLVFANKLKGTDYDRTHLISPDKLGAILSNISSKALNILISRYNPNKFGQINYAELIYGIKGNMDLQRQSLIDDIFNMLDSEQKGELEINKIIAAYKNKSEIGVFKRAIDGYCKFQNIDDGFFTDEDFNDFFEFISFSFSSDQSFQEFIKIGFYGDQPARSSSRSSASRRQFNPKQSGTNNQNENQITGDFRRFKAQEPVQINIKKPKQPSEKGSAYKNLDDHDRLQDIHYEPDVISQASRRSAHHSTISQHHIKEVNMILLRIRRTLASKGTRGFLHFEKVLKRSDGNEDGFLSLDQFRNVIKQQKIDITNVEATNLFGIFDQNKAGKIDYIDFLHTLKGQVPENRQVIILRMWEKAKINEQSSSFIKLKSVLNFRSHPDVSTGRKYDDQIWQEIVDTILMIQDLNEIPRGQTITRSVFFEYCENLSLSNAQDSLFETIALNFWKIGTTVRIQDQYAGSRKVFDPTKKGYLQDHHKYAVNGGTVSQNAPFGTFNTPTVYSTQHQRL